MGQEAESERVQDKRKVRKMRRKISWLLTGALVLGLAGSYTASAHLNDEMNPGMLEEPEVLVFEGGELQQSIKELDLGRKGPSRGDRLYVRTKTLQDGETVFHGLAVCEQFTPLLEFGRRGLLYCDNENHIPGRGTILTSGFQNVRSSTVIDPILGGTGEFRNARGQVTVDFAEGRLTFELLP